MKEWQMAFLAKCWNLFSLSDSTRRVHEQIKEVNQPSFFENEKQKLNEIRSLIDNGKHDEALHAVLQDFAHKDGIRYFNKIRYLESDDKVELNHTTVGGVIKGFKYIYVNGTLKHDVSTILS